MERRRVRIESVEVGVQCKVGESLPRRLIRLDLEGRHADRTLVAHWTASHHRDAVHAAEAHLPAVLKQETLRSVMIFYLGGFQMAVVIG